MVVPRDPATVAVAFVRALRQAGLVVPIDASVTFAAALDHVDLASGDDVYWAGRTTLVRRSDDVAPFDHLFAAFFGAVPLPRPPRQVLQPVTLAVDDPDAEMDDGRDGADADPTVQVRFSRVETLRHKDFAAYDDHELAEAWALMDRLALVGAPRRSRRAVPTARQRGRPDLRRTVGHALRTGGEPIRRSHTVPGERFRRVVLLVDVSGSMEAYARPLLRFVHAAVAARSRVEAFALGTRLTRLTRELRRRDPDEAMRLAAASVADFAGGTRLGEGLRRFNDEWGVRGMARGAVVVILSDGWDRGDPEQLAEQMVRLRRVAHRVVWVNPLKSTPGYAPLARGMAAAIPHVDAFVEGHSIDALERLVAVIAGGAAPVGTTAP
ncbi:MAG: vWA domain-containing protein [Acidimicrobiia bacterium]